MKAVEYSRIILIPGALYECVDPLTQSGYSLQGMQDLDHRNYHFFKNPIMYLESVYHNGIEYGKFLDVLQSKKFFIPLLIGYVGEMRTEASWIRHWTFNKLC